uniref:Dynein regulatory complex subunit 7 n=1 Tax=Cacopsylla melanoneura TaxID=428564 RepID=A0A8D9F480_9HEMI
MATGEGDNVASKTEGEDSILIGRDDIRSFYVKFDRSENKCHDEDVSKVIFNLQHGEISVYYHYGENNITQSYRKFQTSTVKIWDDLTELVKCYRSDGDSTKIDSNQSLSKLIQTWTQRQSDYLQTINHYVTEIRALLNARKIDRYKPKLVASIYYLETDGAAKEAYLKEKAAKREAELKDLAMDFDYAAVYLGKLSAEDLKTPAIVGKVREECLNNLKQIWKLRVELYEERLKRVHVELGELEKENLSTFEKKERVKLDEERVKLDEERVKLEEEGKIEPLALAREHDEKRTFESLERKEKRVRTQVEGSLEATKLDKMNAFDSLDRLEDLKRGTFDFGQRKEDLMNEKVLVHRMLNEYLTREMLAEKCVALERRFDEYVRKHSSHWTTCARITKQNLS